MPSRTGTAEKILNRLKGLRNNLQADEQPLFSMPAIWDGGQGQRATLCDIVVTNLRVFGYFYVSFPRERLFLDALPLKSLRAISLRQKSFEPIFRELLVSSDQRRVYIRAPLGHRAIYFRNAANPGATRREANSIVCDSNHVNKANCSRVRQTGDSPAC